MSAPPLLPLLFPSRRFGTGSGDRGEGLFLETPPESPPAIAGGVFCCYDHVDIIIDCYRCDVPVSVFHHQSDDHTIPTLLPEFPFDPPGVSQIYCVSSKRSPFVLKWYICFKVRISCMVSNLDE